MTDTELEIAPTADISSWIPSREAAAPYDRYSISRLTDHLEAMDKYWNQVMASRVLTFGFVNWIRLGEIDRRIELVQRIVLSRLASGGK